MSLVEAIRLTEIFLALALLQQSLEHLRATQDERKLFIPRIILSILLLAGLWTSWISILLLIHSIIILKHFDGPYNGGSDRMSLLILSCLGLIHLMPSSQLQGYIFGYLALQLILSYFIAGFCKIVNREWWSGQALQDLFHFSAYPASEALRSWADHPKILFLASWISILFELLFPLTLLNQDLLIIGLLAAMVFHLANAYLFGLNRFVWAWLAAYPSLLWLQTQLAN
ncbi:MAG: HTTM domain-containing protein [Cyanobacteria bacterium]|nr:HTTM domain-containing protein [Cyanobacteriota bacterium]MDA1020296.1 HTTM domain-containing protein [Cyanobacteriota bacterium]